VFVLRFAYTQVGHWRTFFSLLAAVLKLGNAIPKRSTLCMVVLTTDVMFIMQKIPLRYLVVFLLTCFVTVM